MKLLRVTDQPSDPQQCKEFCGEVLQDRKRRVHSPHRDNSPVPSYFSEPVSLRHQKLTQVAARTSPTLSVWTIWKNEDETQSLRSLHFERKVKRSRGLAKCSDVKLPLLSVGRDKGRCSLVVQGFGYPPRVSTLPAMCHPGTSKTQGLERPPSRAGRRQRVSLCEGQKVAVEGSPLDTPTENDLPGPARALATQRDSVLKYRARRSDDLVELGISIPTGPDKMDCLSLKPQGWKGRWKETIPSRGHHHGRCSQVLAPQSCDKVQKQERNSLPSASRTGPLQPVPGCETYLRGHMCHCLKPAGLPFLQVPCSSSSMGRARILLNHTVELANSNEGLLPKITMSCPSPKILC